ncbi:MAG TPA: alpha/beta hydrolase-fold protein [Pirellulales bacterium]|nr:alpha/beta hydrolase-fold protein [Pirellulales bacterium]
MHASNGTWERVEVAGRPCEVYEPPERNPHGYAVLYLHDLDQGGLRDKAAFEAELARRGLPALAPLVRRSWWSDKICCEFDPQLTAERHVVDNVAPYAAARFGAAAPRLTLVGIGMGGQGALRLSFKHPNRFPICAAIAPTIDYQHCFYDEEDGTLPEMYADPESARQDTATLHVHPLNWPRNVWFAADPADSPWHDSAEKLRMKLSALGIPHDCDLETTAGGRPREYENLMAPKAFEFIAERLERERLRVV